MTSQTRTVKTVALAEYRRDPKLHESLVTAEVSLRIVNEDGSVYSTSSVDAAPVDERDATIERLRADCLALAARNCELAEALDRAGPVTIRTHSNGDVHDQLAERTATVERVKALAESHAHYDERINPRVVLRALDHAKEPTV